MSPRLRWKIERHRRRTLLPELRDAHPYMGAIIYYWSRKNRAGALHNCQLNYRLDHLDLFEWPKYVRNWRGKHEWIHT